jgi:hypothetical protein
VRQFLSKSIAGGLSAGVVLLWWPVLFERVDTVTSWLVRGVVWTVLLEVLLLALAPVERALWETGRGERLAVRVGAAHSRLHSGTARRRWGRLSALASVAFVIPVALMVMGLQEQAPARAEAPPKRVKVVRVTKVVKVRKVVQGAPVVSRPVVTSTAPSAAAPAERGEPKAPEKSRDEAAAEAPAKRESKAPSESKLTVGSGDPCTGDACGGNTAPATSPSL